MAIEGLERLAVLAAEKAGYLIGGAAFAAISFQRFRHMFRSEQNASLKKETEIDVLGLLRGELDRLQAHCAKLEAIVHDLQLHNIELRQELGELRHQLAVHRGADYGTEARPSAD